MAFVKDVIIGYKKNKNKLTPLFMPPLLCKIYSLGINLAAKAENSFCKGLR
jgi:hypothetical protein